MPTQYFDRHIIRNESSFTVEQLRRALFGERKGYLEIAEALKDGRHASNVVSNLPSIIGHLQDEDQKSVEMVIRSCRGSHDPAVEDLLLEYLFQNQGARYSKNTTRNCVIETLATIPAERPMEALQWIVGAHEEEESARKIALKGLRSLAPQRYEEALDGLFDQIKRGQESTKKSPEERNIGYSSARIFIENDDDSIINRIITSLEEDPKPSSVFAEVLANSTSSHARSALFRLCLRHPSLEIRYDAERLIARQIEDGRSRSVTEETLLSEVLETAENENEIKYLVTALDHPCTERAVRAVIKHATRSKNAINVLSRADVKWNQLLCDEGAGKILLTASYKTSYWGPPQMYHPDEREIRREVRARARGAEILALGDYRESDICNETLRLLLEYGFRHATLGERHATTRQAAAKTILKILRDNRLEYQDKNLMDELVASARERQR